MLSLVPPGSYRSYRSDLSNVSVLTRAEERELAARWLKGDEAAANKIVVACLPFVVSIALEYRRWGIPLEDIVQQGNVGILRAAKKFDPTKDCRLATYAAYWIRAEIREFVVRAFRVVRVGTTKSERKALRAYRTSKATSVNDLMSVSGLSRERVEALLPILSAKETSLSAPLGCEGDESRIEHLLASRLPSPEEEASALERTRLRKIAVTEALKHLNERELFIVKERMLNDDPVTLQALGVRLGVSKERVRQLEERAKIKLRAHLSPLREYAEAG